MDEPFAWADLHALARRLRGSFELREAHDRTIINRSYYAALLAARDFLTNAGEQVADGADVHYDIREKMLAHAGAAGPPIKVRLLRLQKLRSGADYRNPFPATLGSLDLCADQALTMAADVLQELERLAGDG